MADEIWMPIRGYEGLYEVSSLGRIKSLERPVYRKSDGSFIRMTPEIIRTPNIMAGYHCICLIKNAQHKVFRIHRIVLETFAGDAPTSEHQVNHIDGNKANNSIGNLEWVTPMENTRHAIETGLRKPDSTITKKKKGEATKRRWDDPEYRKMQSEMSKRLWSDPEKHKLRAAQIKEGIHKARLRKEGPFENT